MLHVQCFFQWNVSPFAAVKIFSLDKIFHFVGIVLGGFMLECENA